jgi:hypothetical protein
MTKLVPNRWANLSFSDESFKEIIYTIIISNYYKDFETLSMMLRVLASHP